MIKNRKSHDELVRIAIEVLKRYYGAKDNEIEIEYSCCPHHIVDVAYIPGRHKIAIEVGQCKFSKLLTLYNCWDEVWWIPYWIRTLVSEEELLENYIEEEVSRRLSKKLDEFRKYRPKYPDYREDFMKLFIETCWIIFTSETIKEARKRIAQMLNQKWIKNYDILKSQTQFKYK